ncbi:BadF/BadG/BcrA/BcrD ATPase family protein [Actinopolymorpha sp. NPDC004070]|uniref:BadF/BadG/BcrA/BcrD ATPase family protein n=1 Tax=Actinopolymorpha sp. NPDC004070 TaxID=3154548 RepID=UPI0033ABEE6F
MPTSVPYVVAVDAGGTQTRVGCFTLEGVLLARQVGAGGSPSHNHTAAENVCSTIAAAVTSGGLAVEDAVAMTAGVAGYPIDGDADWIGTFFDGCALTCPQHVVNDAVIAHRGALAGEPGIIVVGGTGSMVAAITADGTVLGSGRFQHYAGGARHLVYDVMHRILLGEHVDADRKLVETVLAWWGAGDVTDLRRIALGLGGKDYNDVKRRYGGLAPAVTAAVDTSPLADGAVTRLAEKTAVGVRLLAPLVSDIAVPVALAGALATDPGFADRISRLLSAGSAPSIRTAEAVLDPLGGAALMALQTAGVPMTPQVLSRLQFARVR